MLDVGNSFGGEFGECLVARNEVVKNSLLVVAAKTRAFMPEAN